MPTYISLFSSAGVGCYGFKQERFDCVATNELIERRLNVQKYNEKCRYPSGYICGDITTSEVKEKLFREIAFWREHEGLEEVDVVIATPPCQGMSVANHKKAGDEILRNSLVVESISLILRIRPKFFVMENVPAFLKTACTDLDGQVKPIGDAIDRNLGEDYSVYADVINFKNYGGGSSRNRTLVIGVRRDLADHVAPIELFPDYREERTLRQVIGDLPALREFGETDPADIYHSFRPYPAHMRDWVAGLGEGQSAFDNEDPLRVPHHVKDGKLVINQRKNGDKYRRQIWDRVGPCIHTRNDQFASQNTIHPADDRVFSIRELMRMMSIPEDFQWAQTPFARLNRLSPAQKRAFLKKEEIKIRQSLGEAVPTEVFRQVAGKIAFFLSRRHLKTAEINREIERLDLGDTGRMIAYLKENPLNLGWASLCRIAELANTRRTSNAAYFTNKSLVSEIIKAVPPAAGEVWVLEPSVGVGNFIPLLLGRYQCAARLHLDVVDVDADVLRVLQTLMGLLQLPANVEIRYINADFLTWEPGRRYDLVIGNPPFTKLSLDDKRLRVYRRGSRVTGTGNLSAFFLEKALRLGDYVAMVAPKFLLNTPEFADTRALLERCRVERLIDFGEYGFRGVLVETVAVCVAPGERPGKTWVESAPQKRKLRQRQSYIFDHRFPYWLPYRDEAFDRVCARLELDVFEVFRDRQITNQLLNPESGIRVIKSRNISDDGSQLLDLPGYDAYIEPDRAQTLAVYKYLNATDVYLTPNMSYKPRMMRKPAGMLVNGSAAILTLKRGGVLTERQRLYFSSEEYRAFYRTARNYQTRSLNVDANSVYFFGLLREDEEESS